MSVWTGKVAEILLPGQEKGGAVTSSEVVGATETGPAEVGPAIA